jgi:hypothetical protein
MVVAGLELRGHDSSRATHVLRQFEQLQAKHIAERDRVRKELGL